MDSSKSGKFPISIPAVIIVLMISALLAFAFGRQENQSTDATAQAIDREVIAGPSSGRPYSQAIRFGDTLYVSGQIAIDPHTGEGVRSSVEAETDQVMKNIKQYVELAGFEMKDVVKVTVFLANMEDYSAMNSAYIPFFPEDPPARECVAVKEIVRGYRVEISCIAQR